MKSPRASVAIFVLSVQEDDQLLEKFDLHLQNLEREELITVRHRLDWSAGCDWRQQLKEQLDTATIILPLLSVDFLASDDIHHVWLPYLLARAEAAEAYVLPILLRPVDNQNSFFLHFTPLPDRRKPITTWNNLDEAFTSITRYLRAVIKQISPQAKDLPPLPPLLQQSSHFMAPDLPLHFVERKDEFERLKQSILTKQNDLPIAITAALRGAGGYGKTTLAQALCHDPEIQANFQDRILWVTLGEQAEGSLTTKLENLIVLLTGKHSGVTDLESITAKWREVLADRSCLLVIDDVWYTRDLKPFLGGGPYCVRLITTRNDAVLPTNVRRILVDAMLLDEAMELLLTGFHSGPITCKQHNAIRHLAECLGKWPLLLNLANSMLRRRAHHGETLEKALLYLQQAFEKKGVVAFDERNARARDEAVAKTLEISLEQLTPTEIDRYKALALFPENTAIPLATVQKLWRATGDCDEFETEDLCLVLADLSLLLTYDLHQRFIRIHDVIHGYLYLQVKSRLPSIHKQFLASYQQERWANLARDEPYLWDHLAYHLLAAEQPEILIETLKDLYYVSAKIFVRGISAIERDLLLAKNHIPTSDILRELHRYIIRLAHLHKAQHEADIAATIIAYMYGNEQLKPLYEIWQREVMPPRITACYLLPRTRSEALLYTLTGHTAQVMCCAISPDGAWLVSASADKTLKIWNSRSGEQMSALLGHKSNVELCTISPDGTWLVSASTNGTLKIWDSRSSQELRSFHAHRDRVTYCAISPDGGWLVSCAVDGTFKLWDSQSGQERYTLLEHSRKRRVTHCAISPDGSWLVSSLDNGMLKIWDSQSGQELRTLLGHRSSITHCAISPDGTWLVSCSKDHTLKIWDSRSGEERCILRGHKLSVTCCAISPDGTWLVSCSKDHTLKIWDSHSGQELRSFQGHRDRVTHCAISPDGTWLVSVSADNTLKIWDSHSGQERCTLLGHGNIVTHCAISPDGMWLVSASADNTLKIWDVHVSQIVQIQDEENDVTHCAINTDGRWLASASNEGTLKIWNSHFNQESQFLQSHQRSIAPYSISRNIPSVSENETPVILDGRSRRSRRPRQSSTITYCTISPDGTWLLSASTNGTLKIWDSHSGQELRSFRAHRDQVMCCAISSDGSWFVSASADNTLKIWDCRSGRELCTLQGHTMGVICCAVSFDRNWIVSGSKDTTLKIWDSRSGKELCTLQGHTNSVTCCAISPDGTWLASTSKDGNLKIWDYRSGKPVATLLIDDVLTCCLCHPDGTFIIAGGRKGIYFLRFVGSKVEPH